MVAQPAGGIPVRWGRGVRTTHYLTSENGSRLPHVVVDYNEGVVGDGVHNQRRLRRTRMSSNTTLTFTCIA